MNLLKKTTFLVLISLVSAISGLADVPWKKDTTFQFAKDMELKKLLDNFLSLQGLNYNIDPEVSGKFNGVFDDLPPEEVLDRLSEAYGINWFYDGNIVYVYPRTKAVSKIIEVNSYATSQLLDTMDRLGVVAPSSSIRILEGGNVVFVSGAPQYVEMVSNISKKLTDNTVQGYINQPIVEIFPLQYAWAQDVSFKSLDNNITIPGIATVLRGLMETGNAADVISGATKQEISQIAISPASDKMSKDRKMQGAINELAKEPSDQSIVPGTVQDGKNQGNNKAVPPPTSSTLIQPDIRMNSIIVRDLPERMPQYRAIIKALDKPVELIEISAAIVDIDTSYTRGLNNGFFSFTDPNDPNNFFSLAPSSNVGTSALTTGFNLQGGIVLTGGYRFLSQVQALQDDGYSRILARPSVLTLNNLEAVISRNETFYVRLASERTSDLVNVTVGTTLNVTPRVIEKADGSREIKLLVAIEDGSINADAAVDSIPQTNNNAINTQAVIRENQSLLVGGFFRKTNSTSTTGLPYLKDIPLLGYLFKSEQKNNIMMERLFLITPRIVDLSYDRAPDLKPYFDEPVYGLADAVRNPCADAPSEEFIAKAYDERTLDIFKSKSCKRNKHRRAYH